MPDTKSAKKPTSTNEGAVFIPPTRAREMRAPIVLAICALLAGCAAVPKVDDTPQGQTAEIVGARGPLTERQSKALLEKIAPEPGDAGILKRHMAIEEAVAETPLVAGNSTKLLVDGTQTFAAMFAAIKSAKSTVNLEYYIFEDVESGGEQLGDLLIAKAQQGVAVNIIYDSYGSDATKPDVFKRLKDAGIQMVEFNPVNPLNPITLNNRDHRKMLVVDGATAIVGGINLSSTYESSGPGKSGGVESKPGQHWRDTDLRDRRPGRWRNCRPCSWNIGRSRRVRNWTGRNISPPFRPRAAKWCGSSAARRTRTFPAITSRFCPPSAMPRRMSG